MNKTKGKEGALYKRQKMENSKKNDYCDEECLKNGKQTEQESRPRGGSFIGGVVTGLAAAFLIVSIVFLGTRLQRLVEMKQGSGGSPGQTALLGSSLLNEEALAKLEIIGDTIKDYFYLSKVTDEELQEGMYRGMLEALDDPYSEYYSAEELKDLMEHTSGIYYGIGAYVGMDTVTSLPKISGVIEGTPAQEAGLRANDLIYQVDGTSTYGLTLNEAVSLIKGEEGTQVVLTLIRGGEDDYLEVPVTRRQVESPTVNFEMLGDGMAYIQIVEFDEVTVDQFAEALAVAKGSGMKGLLLDLRANPGGNLDAVVEIARMMLPEGMIVYTEGKDGKRQEYTCDGTRELTTPLVVLVDMNSASAAEILAGAIKDYELGTLVGTTTFGKGIVQQIIPYSDGSAVKLTISSYFTPKGNNIHGKGIEPDVECPFDGEAYYGSEEPYDNQLEKAKELLKEKIKESIKNK